jgi:signal transduction histidine kinase
MREPVKRTARAAVRWYNSVVVRTMLLCAVLLLCLLGSVYLLSGYWYNRVLYEMRDQAGSMAETILTELQERPEENLDEVARRFEEVNRNVELFEHQGGDAPPEVSVSIGPDGRVTKTARALIHHQGRDLLLVTSVSVTPQTEIVRAFFDEYLAGIALVFLVTLGFMVYLIFKTLRPLGQLSETCAKIGAGNLEEVRVAKTTGEVRALEETFNGMVASLREKERMEANLRQAQRLSAIGNLAAGVAHDVRNPLNAIKLLSGHTIDSLENTPGAESAVRQLSTIRNEVNRLEEIVSGFLALARERELAPEPRKVDDLLEEALRLIKKDAEAREIRLHHELRAGDTELMVDAQQWTRAVLNVLINAMEACPPGGRVRVFSRITGEACEVEIRDDGPGMTREQLEHVFDPYYTTKATGTGLGLSITRGIIEEHGGTITITATPGQGCQVLIAMPLTPAAE